MSRLRPLSFENLPHHARLLITEAAVRSRDFKRALRLRLVSRDFYYMVEHSIFDLRLLNPVLWHLALPAFALERAAGARLLRDYLARLVWVETQHDPQHPLAIIRAAAESKIRPRDAASPTPSPGPGASAWSRAEEREATVKAAIGSICATLPELLSRLASDSPPSDCAEEFVAYLVQLAASDGKERFFQLRDPDMYALLAMDSIMLDAAARGNLPLVIACLSPTARDRCEQCGVRGRRPAYSLVRAARQAGLHCGPASEVFKALMELGGCPHVFFQDDPLLVALVMAEVLEHSQQQSQMLLERFRVFIQERYVPQPFVAAVGDSMCKITHLGGLPAFSGTTPPVRVAESRATTPPPSPSWPVHDAENQTAAMEMVTYCRQGNTAMVQRLVEAGARIDDDVFRGFGAQAPMVLSPLAAAVSHGHVDTAAWLLEHGADPNPSDSWFVVNDAIPPFNLVFRHPVSPLAAACRIGSLPLARLLVRYGASVNDTVHGVFVGSTALVSAVRCEHADLVRFLVNEASVDVCAPQTGSRVLRAARHVGLDSMADLLAELGVGPSAAQPPSAGDQVSADQDGWYRALVAEWDGLLPFIGPN